MKGRGLQVLFSVNSYAATLLALYIGFSLGLPRPYWAMATAYIVSQPLSGALRSKAAYRLAGTALGVSVAMILVPTFADAPAVLSLALCAWVGLCVYLSLLDRTPRAYVFLLGGYTAAIIGFPTAPNPALVFDTGVARAEEIGLGLICATVVHSVVMPQGVGPALSAKIEAWLNHMRGWSLDILAGVQTEQRQAERRRLAADATAIRILSTHLPFDTSNLRETVALVRVLQDRMTAMLPLMTAVADRLAVLRDQGGPPPEVQRLMDGMSAWLSDPHAPDGEALRLMAEADAAGPRLGPDAAWRDVVLDNLVDRLRQAVEAVRDIRDLRAAIEGRRRAPGRLAPELHARRRTPLHRDHALAALSGLAAALASGACCVLWIATGWPEGSVAALTAAVFCSFFAVLDDPAPAIAGFLLLTLASIPIVALYQFAILPAIDGFPMLALVLAPPMLVLGYFMANPKTFPWSIALVLGMSNGLALAENFSPDFAGFANSNVSQVIGLCAALIVTRLIRSVGAEWAARRILRAGWRELARVAESRTPPDRTGLAVLMVDRLGLVTQRISVSAERDQFRDADAMRDLRVGLTLQELQQARPVLGPQADEALAGLGAHFRRLSHGKPPEHREDLLVRLDTALAGAAATAATVPLAAIGVRALVGLRRNLFPAAPPYAPPSAEGAA